MLNEFHSALQHKITTYFSINKISDEFSQKKENYHTSVTILLYILFYTEWYNPTHRS